MEKWWAVFLCQWRMLKRLCYRIMLQDFHSWLQIQLRKVFRCKYSFHCHICYVLGLFFMDNLCPVSIYITNTTVWMQLAGKTVKWPRTVNYYFWCEEDTWILADNLFLSLASAGRLVRIKNFHHGIYKSDRPSHPSIVSLDILVQGSKPSFPFPPFSLHL